MADNSFPELLDESDGLSWEERARIRQNDKQEMFHRWKVFDEDQEGFLRTEIAVLLFGQVEIPDPANPPPLNLYHTFYSETQKQNIETIVSQIRKKIPSPQQVTIGYTFLTARVEGDKDLQEYVVFRCATANLARVFFIEPSGRVYRDWKDFIDSNKLPHCEYMGPYDGIHKLEGAIRKYRSPEANKNFVERHVDKVMTVAGVGIIGAGIFSIAPVTLAVTGVALSGYSTIQSFFNLRDRYEHEESIRPDNLEAISSHLTIATAGLTGASSVALACRQQIMNRCGRWAPALLRTMSIGVLSLDAAGLVFNSYVFYGKWSSGEWTYMDTFNLALQVYLLHGQLSNTLELHRMLSPESTAAPPRLTKTQKRNLRKRRAKAAKRGQQLSPSTVTVIEAKGNSFDSMNLALRMVGNAVPQLLRHFPRERVIFEFLTDMKQLISNLWRGCIGLPDFFLNLEHHCRNLMQILEADINSLRRYASLLGIELAVNTVGAAYNGIDRVNDNEDRIAEELDRMIQEIPGDVYEPTAPELDSMGPEFLAEPAPEDDGIMYRIDVELILNAVKKLIGKCIVHQNCALLLVFGEGVKYIRRVVVTELIDKYELAFSVNMALLNDSEQVTEGLKGLGVKIGDHFFSARTELEAKLAEAVEKVEQTVSFV